MDYEKNAPIHSLVKRKAVNKKQKQEKMHLLVTLLTFGDVDIDQCNGEGHTALHIAVMVSKSLTTCLHCKPCTRVSNSLCIIQKIRESASMSGNFTDTKIFLKL